MRTTRFFNKQHDCQVKKEYNILARRMGSGLTEIEAKARNELWLFCPWCGERLAEFVEAGETTNKIHIYETDSERSRAIPMRGEYIRINCDKDLLVGQILYNESDVKQEEICPECLLQQRLFQPKFRFFLKGKIEKLAPATP